MENEYKCAAAMSAEEHLVFAIDKETSLETFLDTVFRVMRVHTDFYQKYGLKTAEATVLQYVSKHACEYVCGDKAKASIATVTKELRKKEVSLERPSNANNLSEKSLSEAVITSSKSASNGSKLSVDANVDVRADRDDYNGATCQEYSWSQAIHEVDVIVPIENSVSSSRHVRVVIRSDDLTVLVNVGGDWVHKINGHLSHTIRPMNSIWTLHPHSHIHVSLEKERELWWNELITGEQHVRVGSKDRSVQFEHLTDDAQAMVQKLAYEQYLKSKHRSLSH